jgi:flagellar biosynthesis protein FliP
MTDLNLVSVPAPLLWALVLPALLCCATAYAKATILLGILRSGLGMAAVLPPLVLHAAALVLAFVLVLPLAPELVGQGGGTPQHQAETLDAAYAQTAFPERWRPFLFLNTHATELQAVIDHVCANSHVELSSDTWTVSNPPPWVIVGPAFLLTELREALTMALLLLCPFLMVDVLTLVATTSAGLQGPVVERISMWLKLLLFLTIGGWTALAKGLWLGYRFVEPGAVP